MFLNLLPPAPPNNGETVFDQCPPGSMMVDGVCVGDPSTYGPTTTSTISPMLILAAVAAYFIAG